jgi:MraZ protein
MAVFSGTFRNTLDSKNRVSVPAPFRTILKRNSHAGEGAECATMYLRRSHLFDCIEGWTEIGFEGMNEAEGDGDEQFPSDHDDFTVAMFSDAEHLRADPDGRIVLPAGLVDFARLEKVALFIGSRHIFQIWEPEAGERRIAEARAKAREKLLTVKSRPLL